MEYIKGYVQKSIPGYAYFAGETGLFPSDKAADLVKKGFIAPLPDEDKSDNTLPEDFPSRDILFENGFDTVDKVLKAGETLTEISGIGSGTLKKIKEWTEKNG